MVKIKYPLARSKPWAFWEWVDIPSAKDPELAYLRRLRIIQTPWFSVMFHLIFERDDDRDPHDHPWNFLSIVVRGGYTEEVYDTLGSEPKQLTHGLLGVHFMPVHKAHQIRVLKPKTTTLIVTGKRQREFCFWTEDGMVPWTKYVKG